MIHYPRIIAFLGPLRLLSTINFESMHSFLKSTVDSSKIRISPHLTIAKNYPRSSSIFEDPNIEQNVNKKPIEIPKLLYADSNDYTEECFELNKITLHHNTYKKGSIIFVNKERNMTFFLEIERII